MGILRAIEHCTRALIDRTGEIAARDRCCSKSTVTESCGVRFSPAAISVALLVRDNRGEQPVLCRIAGEYVAK